MGKVFFFHALFTLGFAFVGRAQVTNEHSVARKWNEALLFAIRKRFCQTQQFMPETFSMEELQCTMLGLFMMM